jgi:hypothetical protein
MRIRALAAVGVTAALGVGAVTVAVAQTAQVNEYTVHGDVKPNKPGTKAKPVPVELKVGWDMREASGLRPKTVRQYTIKVYGGRENTDLFPTCPAQRINDAQSDDGCPKGAKVGTGYLEAEIGAASDPSDTSIHCRLPITLYNGGNQRVSIYLETGPPACPVPIAQAIDARFVKAFGTKGRGLQFEVPENLQQPIPGLMVAVTEVRTTMLRRTTRVKGKLRGFLEADQPCDKGERYVEIEFVTIDGERASARDAKRC